MLQTALVFGFWINYGVDRNISSGTDRHWHIPVAAHFIPVGLLLLSMPFLIESPRWLVSKNRISEATRALCCVRNLDADHEYLRAEMEEIQTSITDELGVSCGRRSTVQIFREICAPGIRNRVILSVPLMLLQNLTGINAVNYCSPTILKSIGFTGTSVGLLATGIYGLVKMLTTLVFMVFFVDRFGRRPALLIGAVGAMIAMFYLAAYSKMSGTFDGRQPPKGSGSQAALAMIYIYAIFYGFSWIGIPWIFASKLMPNRVRTLGMVNQYAFLQSLCMQWLAQFLVVYFLPHMIAGIKYGTLIFFGSCTVVAFFFAYFLVPEAKGVSLEDMDLMFGNGAPLLARAARGGYLGAHQAGINVVSINHVEGKNDVEYKEEA